MKRKLLLIVFLFAIIRGFTNPVAPPPLISEIYLNGNVIQMEFCIDELWLMMYEFENFNDILLVSSIDTVSFIEGIEIIPYELFVLNQDDLEESFEYNPEGDMIMLVTNDDFFEIFSIRFGNYPWAFVPAPNENQSIAYHDFYFPNQIDHDYWLCLEEPPTIGENCFEVNARGGVEGYVYDLNNDPLSDVYAQYPYNDMSIMWDVVSDSTGHFWMPNLLCRDYTSIKYGRNGCTDYFSVTILPSQYSFVEIQLDTIFVGIPEYYNYPNPFSDATSFNVQIPDNLNYNSAFVYIYDMSGKMLDRIEVPKNQYTTKWENIENKPGIYVYQLVVDNKSYASHKMIIL